MSRRWEEPRLFIVGQAPSSTSDPLRPLCGAPARELARHIGEGLAQKVLHRCVPVNLLHRYPGKEGKGDAFPRAEAISAARSFNVTASQADLVLLLGRRVAAAFCPAWSDGEYLSFLGQCPRFGGRKVHGPRYWLFPHPSGINRWWNSAENCHAAAKFLKRLPLP